MRQLRYGRRLMLMLAVILGVLAMHGLVNHAQPVTGGDTVAITWSDAPHAQAAAAAAMVSADPDGTMPSMPPHGLLHLCLAVLAAGVLLLLGVGVLAALGRVTGVAVPRVAPRASTAPRRPPPGHAVRLAELCVLRN